MHPVLQSAFQRSAPGPWSDTAPVREELFGIERLEQHARSLAAAQQVSANPPRVPSLHGRLRDNAAQLLLAYRGGAGEVAAGRRVVPAAEWLLDNYHVVEAQVREIRTDLPPGYYRQLPKLADGPLAGYPRVFGLAWAFVAHTDSHFDPAALRRFIAAYQEVQPLDISELWAVAITLRIVLVENLRRLADQITAGRAARADAQRLADRLLEPGGAYAALNQDIATRASGPVSELFAAQLAKRLRDQDPRTTPALQWLDERLRSQDTDTDQAILHAQQRQGASNVSVRNVITSMRLMSDIDWADVFESTSLVDARLRAASAFAEMDFPTRNRYRTAIEQLARGSPLSELAIAERALALAAAQKTPGLRAGDAGTADPGHYLIAEGRGELEQAIGFRPPLALRIGRFNVRLGLGGYVAAILALAAVLLGLAFWAVFAMGASAAAPAGLLAALALAAFLPATEVATALVQRAIASRSGAVGLPAMALAGGVPADLRTLVVVPTLLSSEAELRSHIESLEVHHLAGAGGDLSFALLSDGLDADAEVQEGDARLIGIAQEAIAILNQRHGPAPGGKRFYLLHRRRRFNASENRWMGWERKRGKLHELNRLLRGATDTSFMPLDGAAGNALQPDILAGVRYVITLDADTRLPRDAALRLIGKMAHPLNRVRWSDAEQRVTGGYAILQPRVTPALPLGREGSLYQRLSSGTGGMDAYAAAVSDVYQDLFGEGSYTGKGIYDVDAFETALAGRIPENTMLSHDLFEGVFARAGLASDVEVVEEFPARYDVAARRQHRWMRGDWQLLPWVLGRRHSGAAVPPVGRWKMIDNLRRSLLAPTSLLALALCAWLPWPQSPQAMALLLLALAGPAFLPSLSRLGPPRAGVGLGSHLRLLASDLRMAALQAAWALALLPDQAWRAMDAITRTLLRLYATHRHLLEWTTAAQSAARPRPGVMGFYGQMAGGVLMALALATGLGVFSPAGWPVASFLLALWLAAPALAWRASRRAPLVPSSAPGPADALALRRTARRTWRFFETFVTPAEHMLPPDNFQEDPKPVVAHRTSPTNVGLYLLSAVAARDFGWAGALQTCERLEAAFLTLQALERFRGHFYNWYDTRTTRVLVPAYVSSVDSGNLAGHLIALANACDEWVGAPMPDDWTEGAGDALALARESASAKPAVQGPEGQRLLAILDDIDAGLLGPASMLLPVLQRLADKAAEEARALVPAAQAEGDDLLFWTDTLRGRIEQQARDTASFTSAAHGLDARWQALAQQARALALGMDFAFLLDPERKLLSIGYATMDNVLDANCYDLLASEARLASLFAIAKGDAPTRHWFRLGRTAIPVGHGSALVSWSGSMFEYLMPSLVMRAPAGSLLEQTNRLIVQHQVAYGRQMGVPWGISESAYNARDLEFTYQYSNFGVPGLGLKRGLAEDLVIAPYATGLAAMVDAPLAERNFERLRALGALGRHGFYEALDFTRARVPGRAQVAIVHNYMAHHQGMTLVAIANTLQGARMRERFHREPMIQSCELLLQERMPRLVAVAHARAEEVPSGAADPHGDLHAVRRMDPSAAAAPATHLLSNGRYAVMLTTAGTGYSRWRDLAVTRWREDATRDDWGAYVYLRDTDSGQVWSAAVQPVGVAPDSHAVVFAEDHAAFTRCDGSLTTTMEVLVSAEADGEVRRVAVINTGRKAREVELTSYAEVVLAPPAADAAHPAFAKMFVQTEYLPEFGALVATRRPRTPDEAPVWAAHFAVVEGVATAPVQYESDRARFLGRGRTAATAQAMADGCALSGTAGTVLDAVFSVRHRVRIAPGRTARLAFWTLVAPTREALLDLVDQHHDRSAFERARTLAWTQAQVQLRHIGIEADEAADFQRLAAPILYADARFRAPAEAIERGAGPQSGLWRHAVSGDLPIVMLPIDDIEDIAHVRQLLRAHEYWRMKGLSVDLVIVNERASSYVQDLQIAIETAVRRSQSRPRLDGEALARGVVHTLRADLMETPARALLQSAARVFLHARGGGIARQMARPPALESVARLAPEPRMTPPAYPLHERVPGPFAVPDTARLEYFNGLGGFDQDGREYVTVLTDGRTTPAPWINVIANPGFGFQVSADGSTSTWAGNSRENQLTPWSNDPVTDPTGEAFFVRDEASGQLWSPTAQPIRGRGTYVARHGHGYSRFTHEAHGIALELLQFVPLEDPVKVSRLTLHNRSAQTRRLSVTAYGEWVLGASRAACAPFVLTEVDAASGVLLARNPWSTAFPGRVAFADLAGRQSAWTADRTEFLGRHGSLAAPAALRSRAPLSGAVGAGLDPCAALQCHVVLRPGESVEVVALIGQCGSAQESLALATRWRAADLDAELQCVRTHWDGLLGAVQVRTPDRAMDILLNGWLLYQTLACRIWARSAFYQASGAYGFRDQLQDGMALAFARPDETRRHLLRAAGRQFIEGDVQHWWLPHSGQGVRTRISDDRVWLAFAAASYVTVSGDAGVLDEPVAFLEGPALQGGEHDAFFQPMPSGLSATLFEHCARALDQSIALTGELGLPLMGTGDWNDGMNRVGQEGRGESVWLGWLLVRTLALFGPLAETRDPARAGRWRAHAQAVTAALEREAWDGAWYRRATFDDGTWLGTSGDEECRIDSIAQSWAVLSGAADPDRARAAMDALHAHLLVPDPGLALLFTPPFDRTPRDPGYILGYPPGLRENGGQYSHAAMWAILAFTQLRADPQAGARAHALFALVNPIHHAGTPQQAARYRVEPYVVAADVYSVAPHEGRGGWTWYTGAAGWMYRAGVEGILGIRREGEVLVMDPCIPAEWPGFEAEVVLGAARYAIQLESPGMRCAGISSAVLDGTALACDGSALRVPITPGHHRLLVTL
ncbi:glycosyl transferase [Paracidovorax avenae]|uniref:GH36-type glycosyl hydrolase domain-containing protein n=1 Tax=Paracidovorax avenae TaxID=80867 RepID=UPI000D1668DC|nr:glucoamylase family protein [Paracidovorax avenae]AVS80936.1 glycosyl transferase [Paracidovorax avenae]AVT16174.1 glycosyl transferase [Paracidovorax avenae]